MGLCFSGWFFFLFLVSDESVFMEKTPVKKADLLAIANQAMVSNGLEPDFPPDALAQLDSLQAAAREEGLPDLTGLLWCSIDNDDSRDLDQLTVAEKMGAGTGSGWRWRTWMPW